jgi:nitric oxide reductase large subunit
MLATDIDLHDMSRCSSFEACQPRPVWNFVGAGIFGFLINLPVASYFGTGTLLNLNHGHAAMMGVFGMLAVALVVFSVRHVSTEEEWRRLERRAIWCSFSLACCLR